MSSRGSSIVLDRRRVAVVTGTRAEYGLLSSTLSAVDQHPRLKLQLVVTGMHLLRKFGSTVRQITSDGWKIDVRVRMQLGDDSPIDQAIGLSRGVAGMARFFVAKKTDIVVVLGDRIEALAGALAGVTTGCVLAHIHGGDVAPGDLDDSIRNAITKLAHVHFPATRSAARRIRSMGEAGGRIRVVGAPGLDELLPYVEAAKMGHRRGGFALVVQHPCGRPAQVERKVMSDVLDAIAGAGLKRVVLYPNSDRGHSGILEALDEHRRRDDKGEVRVIPSLPRDEYLRLLIDADVIVGNSSSGIIEAATAGTPAVNVGDRQAGRERSGRYVVDSPERRTSILRAIRHALTLRPRPGAVTVYGSGTAGRDIADHLAGIPIGAAFRRKQVVQ